MKQWLVALERRGAAPSTAGWVALGVGLFCFLAGTNTLSGWLFAIAGLCWALLAIAAVLVRLGTKNLTVHPLPVAPCSAGYGVAIVTELANRGDGDRSLFSIWPHVPPGLDLNAVPAISWIASRQSQTVTLQARAPQRGIYRWSGWWIRTGAPLGLWWYRRWIDAPGEVAVYPRSLPLATCPVVMAAMGQVETSQARLRTSYRDAAQGETRSLRPYRRGDALRLVHWRSSARYGELRSRELEMTGGKRPLALAIDTSSGWQSDDFEQAAIAATSIYLWSKRQEIELSLRTAMGEVNGDRQILAVLAEIQPNAEFAVLPDVPVLWFTCNANSVARIAPDSYWFGWGQGFPRDGRGVCIDPHRDLRQQLQALPGSR
ncbi:MAG: DUF58 domain-containing protein [Cyanobacteria bacterium J06648_11]